MAAAGINRILLALLLAHAYGVLGAGFGIALDPFLQRGLPGDVPMTAPLLGMLALAAASFALETALFLFVAMTPTAVVTLPLTYAAARWISLPRWAATLLGVAFVAGIAWPLGSATLGGGWSFPDRGDALAVVLGGVCFAQPIWRRCMRPRLETAAATPT